MYSVGLELKRTIFETSLNHLWFLSHVHYIVVNAKAMLQCCIISPVYYRNVMTIEEDLFHSSILLYLIVEELEARSVVPLSPTPNHVTFFMTHWLAALVLSSFCLPSPQQWSTQYPWLTERVGSSISFSRLLLNYINEITIHVFLRLKFCGQ